MSNKAIERRRCGINYVCPSGLIRLLGDHDPDLTVGAIAFRRFAPLKYAKGLPQCAAAKPRESRRRAQMTSTIRRRIPFLKNLLLNYDLRL